jgi:DNA-binding XRE family transcriptional regulator
MRVINHVKAKRKALNMRRETLAELVGVSEKTIRNLENPNLEVNTNIRTCYLLSVYLHTPLVELFEFKGVITVAQAYPEDVCQLANYLIETYGDYGDPTTLEGLLLYPECPQKVELMQLLGY